MTDGDVIRVGNVVPQAELGNGNTEKAGNLGQGVPALDGVLNPAGPAGTAGNPVNASIINFLHIFEFLVHGIPPVVCIFVIRLNADCLLSYTCLGIVDK